MINKSSRYLVVRHDLCLPPLTDRRLRAGNFPRSRLGRRDPRCFSVRSLEGEGQNCAFWPHAGSCSEAALYFPPPKILPNVPHAMRRTARFVLKIKWGEEGGKSLENRVASCLVQTVSVPRASGFLGSGPGGVPGRAGSRGGRRRGRGRGREGRVRLMLEAAMALDLHLLQNGLGGRDGKQDGG